MKRCLLVGVALFVSVYFAEYAFSASYDLTGSWNCSFSEAWANGDTGCSTGPNPSGYCTITQDGDTFTLVLFSLCNPAFVCEYSGTVNGATYSGSNGGALDQSGEVTNAISFTASSDSTAAGSSTSTVSYPDWVCNWGFNSVTLTRASQGQQFTLTVNILGSGSVTLNPAGGIYDPGTEVNLTAAPDIDWEFIGWSGDLSGTENPAATIMDTNKNVTAQFIPKTPRMITPGVPLLLFED